MRLLVLNPVTDVDDPVRGFTAGWIDALARRVESVQVITMLAGRFALPGNVRVHSMGKEKGFGEPRRLLELQRHLWSIHGGDSIDACFSHMSPMLTVVAAPLLKLWRVPIVMWYAHRQVTARVRIANFLSDRVVSVNETSYRLGEDKFTPLGHGIDLRLFSSNGRIFEGPPLLLSVGRISPIKDQLTLVEAVSLLRARGHDVRCALVGDEERSYLDYSKRLRQRVADLALNGAVEFVGPVPGEEVAGWYRRCFVHVNLCPTGALDKAPLEAMACGAPSLVCNEGFRSTLGRWAGHLLFEYGSPADLAAKVEGLLQMGEADRDRMGDDLSRSVADSHGLEGFADRLIEVLEAVARKKGRV